MKSIYLDYAATSPTRPEVVEKMLPYFTEIYGNPSSFHKVGQAAKKAIEDARAQVASVLGADPDEIYFTGSGTEADNWAVKAISILMEDKGRHVITSAVEHHAILHSCEYLETRGYRVTVLPVDQYGQVSPDDFAKAIQPDTIFASIMMANNEVGTIQPIRELAAIAREHGVLFHTDAVQAVGHLPIDVKDLGIDMLSLAGHKFGGPKGVGALYIKKHTKTRSFIHGGMQEKGRRASTENVPYIVGMGEAITLAEAEREAEFLRLTALRDRMIREVMEKIPDVQLNGHPTNRLPNNVNFSIKYIEGEGMLLLLDGKGICASSGSACTSGALDPSHVLLAMGLPHEIAHGSLRLSMGPGTTPEDVDYLVETLPPIVERLRAMSPLL